MSVRIIQNSTYVRVHVIRQVPLFPSFLSPFLIKENDSLDSTPRLLAIFFSTGRLSLFPSVTASGTNATGENRSNHGEVVPLRGDGVHLPHCQPGCRPRLPRRPRSPRRHSVHRRKWTARHNRSPASKFLAPGPMDGSGRGGWGPASPLYRPNDGALTVVWASV